MIIAIGGRRLYLWRAVDDEGEVFDGLLQSRHNHAPALKLMRRLLTKQGIATTWVTTDRFDLAARPSPPSVAKCSIGEDPG